MKAKLLRKIRKTYYWSFNITKMYTFVFRTDEYIHLGKFDNIDEFNNDFNKMKNIILSEFSISIFLIKLKRVIKL